MGQRAAPPRCRGCGRGSRPRCAALDRARDANGGPLAAAPLPLPAWATAPANTDIRWVADMIALSLAGAADPELPPQHCPSSTRLRPAERTRYTRTEGNGYSMMSD